MADLLNDVDVGLAPSAPPSGRILTDEEVGLGSTPQRLPGPTVEAANVRQRAIAQNSVVPGVPRPPTVEEEANRIFGFEDLQSRGIVWPFGMTREGKPTVATPQVVKDMIQGYVGGAMGASGAPVTPQDATRAALDVGLPVQGAISNTSVVRAPLAGPPIPTRRNITKFAPSTEELEASAIASRTANTGLRLSSNAQNSLTNRLVQVAERNRVRPTGRAASILGLVKDLSYDLGRSPGLDDLVQQRQLIQDAISEGTPASKRIGMEMLDEFDSFVDELAENTPQEWLVGGPTRDLADNLRNFRNDWSKAKKSQTVENIIKVAETQASGFENGIRIGFRRLLNNPKRLRSFTDDEQKVIESIVKGDETNVQKLIGKLGFRLEGNRFMGGALGAGAGAAAAGPAGAMAVPLMGLAASKAADERALQHALYLRGMAATGGRAPKDGMLYSLLRQIGPNRAGGPLSTAIPQGSRQAPVRPTEPSGRLPFQPYNPDIL